MEYRAYRVSGRVQRVGFREWTRRTAERLDLAGTVRNLPDGRVEIRAQGSKGALDELEVALRKGPLAARVDEVERLSGVADEAAEGFRVISLTRGARR